MPQIDLISLRYGQETDWEATNPVLYPGEPGVVIETGKMKIGDGTSTWQELPFTVDGEKGEQGDDGIVIGATPPPTADSLWADTTTAGDGVYTGPPGPVGPAGPTGPAGPGLPVGGTTGQVVVHDATTTVWQSKPQIDARDYGVTGDGTTNDLANLRLAVTAAAGGTLVLAAGTFLLSNAAVSAFFAPGAKTTIRGQGAANTTLIVSATTAAQRSIFDITASDVSFQGLTVRRASDFAALMFALGPGVNNTTFTDCVFDGGEALYSTAFTHGIYIAETGAISGVRSDNCTWTGFDYPWLQNNTSVCAVTDVRFRNCKILDFVSGGLSFNAPIAENRDIVLDTCRFVAPNGRIAAAFAHVTGGTITNCYFKNAGEAVHIEDYSTAIRVHGNEMDECSETVVSPAASGVITVIDSNNVKVSGNTVRNLAAVAHASKALITVAGSPTGTTVGGRPKLNATYDVTIIDNQIQAGPNLAIQVGDCASYDVSDNTLVGGLVVNPSTFVETGTNIYAGLVLPRNTLIGSTIKGNRIRGFLYGIVPSIATPFTIGTFNYSTVIAHNTIVGCHYGIIGNNCRPATFQGNTIIGCVHPFTVGATGNASDGGGCFAYCITGNNMYGNQRRASINGGMVIIAAGAGVIGSAVTVNCEPLLYDLSGGGTGKVVTFSGGGVLTTTVSRPAPSTSITGNITVANIASGEVGWVTGFVDRANESPFNVNNRAVATNADTVANTYT